MSYWRDARHPMPSLLFIVPMLAVYEFGVIAVGGPQALAVRNGADAWMRWLLAAMGLGHGLIAPIVVCLALAWWGFRRRTPPPKDSFGVVLGIAFESIALGIALWIFSRSFGPMLDAVGISMSAPAAVPGASQDSAVGTPLAQFVTYLGAGIYEEVIFRLGLFFALSHLLQAALISRFASVLLAAGISAVAFAAVHHVGPHGDAANGYVLGFRMLAGLLFTALFTLRGFGVTVGTHACYDVLVGISV